MSRLLDCLMVVFMLVLDRQSHMILAQHIYSALFLITCRKSLAESKASIMIVRDGSDMDLKLRGQSLGHVTSHVRSHQNFFQVCTMQVLYVLLLYFGYVYKSSQVASHEICINSETNLRANINALLFVENVSFLFCFHSMLIE